MTRSPIRPPPADLPSWTISIDLDSGPPFNPYLQDPGNPNIQHNTEFDPDTSTSSTWLPQGQTKQGFVINPDHPREHLRSKVPPSIATHRGSLWMAWTDFDDEVWYSSTVPDGHGETFGRPCKFPYHEGKGKNGIPMIANLNGVLHAIVVSADTGLMAHYINDAEEDAFIYQGPLPEGSVAAKGSRGPALAAFHNKLFLAFIGPDQRLSYNQWDADSQAWSPTQNICRSQFQGKPALFVLNGALHVLCEAADPSSGDILGYRYGYSESGWAWDPADDVSEGRATRGVSAASYGGYAYLGFLKTGGDDGAVYVAAHADGSAWGEPERVGGESVKARFAPQMAVRNGRVYCVFAGKWKGDLRWFSKPVLGYDLKTWMGALDDRAWLSNLTIPGTHDSCARSNVPFVRTQYLSVSQQLALGIRFLDLRLRRHDDGKLYYYHGGVPINLPKGLSFESVMDEVWDFIGPKEGKKATEAVLISINNDDRSEGQKANPEVFYDAVKEAVDSTPPHEDGSSRWYTEPVTARLGDVRGKAVLLRRYYGHAAVAPTERMGLDLEEWRQDDPDFTIVTPNGVRVRLQDKWKYSKRSGLEELVASKLGHVRRMMELAMGAVADVGGEVLDPGRTWFINFCSAVGEPVEHGEVAEAKWIAVGAHSNLHFFGRWIEGVNVRTRDYLRGLDEGAGRGRTRRLGVINLDYPELPEDSDLVARLIETNF
ncbi:putative phosphatidylinositol phospholipase c [Diaporthe ampelina]|uniref:Putative phosphatidylinositol phospholipase c n=1 Tax=Diaporthe ampelina TaxID=1214573 RepID=A0A0G2FG60_9PEZI|nr:putative phosphatidylinositol phospholipase c [Diaporthe ampelina]